MFSQKIHEKEIGKHASAGKDKLWLQKSHYYDVYFGLLSIVVIGVLFANMLHYIDNVNAADQAVKICRINVNAAARNIREMALILIHLHMTSYEQGAKTA